MTWLMSVIQRVFIMSAVVFFTLLTGTLTMLAVPIVLFTRSLKQTPADRKMNKHYANEEDRAKPSIIEGQYRVID